MVHPDKRKGLVYIHQSSDSLIHFCWKDRQSGNVEDVSYFLIKFFHKKKKNTSYLPCLSTFRIGLFSLMIVNMFEYLNVPLEESFF